MTLTEEVKELESTKKLAALGYITAVCMQVELQADTRVNEYITGITSAALDFVSDLMESGKISAEEAIVRAANIYSGFLNN